MKSFAENNLMPDEKIIYSTKLHRAFYIQVIPFLVLALLSFVVGPILAHSIEASALIFILIGLLFLMGAFFDWLYIRLLIKSSEFVITNKRLIMKRGIFSTKTIELLHTKIESLSIDQDIPAKLFGYGTVTATGSGGTRNHFVAMEKPFEFRKIAQDEINKVQALSQKNN